jgi:maleate isomerase
VSLEYAPRGFVGVLTPQANTAVEPECGILLPAGVGLLAGRLVSPRPTIEERLVDYFETLDAAAAQFANAPLRALGFACTGSSYLAGRQREDAVLARLAQRTGCHVTSAARAVVDALHALDAQRIALVSPYPDSLTQHSIGYWQSRGFAVGPVAKVTGDSSGRGHPIYGLGSDAALQALRGLDEKRDHFDAVVMLGTGLPTLRAILAVPRIAGAPVLSCTLALAWRCVRALEHAEASAASLLEWIAGNDWRERYRQRTLVAHDGTLTGR